MSVATLIAAPILKDHGSYLNSTWWRPAGRKTERIT
jgi:hypothetical protein